MLSSRVIRSACSLPLMLAPVAPCLGVIFQLDRDEFNAAASGQTMHVDDFESLSFGPQPVPMTTSNGLLLNFDAPFIIGSASNGSVLINNSVPLEAPRTFTGFAPDATLLGMDVLLSTDDEYTVTVKTASGDVFVLEQERGQQFDGFFGVRVIGDAIVRVTFQASSGSSGPGGSGGGIGNYGFDNIAVNAVTPPVVCPGDADASGVVDINDLNEVLGAWNTSVSPVGSGADVEADGVVNIDDLNLVLAHWGLACD